MSFYRTLLGAIAGLSLSAAAQAAPVVSVNFVGGRNGDGTGGGSASVTTTAGAVAVGNWNNAGPSTISPGSPLNLTDNSGSGTVATLSYTSPNTWAATGAAPGGGGSADLMSGYLDNFQGNTMTVSGLGSAFTSVGYSVLVYQNTDSAGSWGYTVADNASNSGTAYGRQLTGNGGNYPLGGTDGFVASTAGTDGTGGATASNYIILTGFTGSSFTITGVPGSLSGGDNRVRPNGFQVVAAPEPASLGLMGLGAMGLLARRRRDA